MDNPWNGVEGERFCKGLFAAKAYFLWNNASNACIYPFLNLYFQRRGFSKRQIGWISAIRPWIAAISGNIWAAIADQLQAHFVILVVMYVLGVLLRTSMMLAPDFTTMLVVVIAKEFCGSPVGIIVDATVIAASKQDSDYGKTRMWGTVGWGGFSPIAGLVMSRYGIDAAFIISLIMGAMGTVLAALLPVQALSHERAPAGSHPRPSDPSAQPLCPKPLNPGAHVPAAPSTPPPNRGEMIGANPNHHMVRLLDTTLDVGRRPDGYVTVTVITGKGEKEKSTDPGFLSAHGTEDGLWKADAAVRPCGAVEAADSPCIPSAARGDDARRITSGARRGGVSDDDDDDVAWPASWPPHDFSMLGPSTRGLERSRSLDRIPSLFLHEVGAHVPVAPVPEMLAYDEVSLAWTAAALKESRTCDMLASEGDEEAGLQAPLLLGNVPDEEDDGDPGVSGQAEAFFLQKIATIFAQEGAPVFFAMAVLMGYAMGTIDFALFLYLDELGASEALMGLTVTVTCISEVPVFFFTGWLLRKLGVSKVLNIVLGCFLLRLFCYTQLQAWGTPWAVLPVELLHGVTFGCAWASGTVNCARLAPPGLQTTTQAIFNSLYQGIGLGLGGLVGGLIYHTYGSRAVFVNAACVVAAGWSTCLVLQYTLPIILRVKAVSRAR